MTEILQKIPRVKLSKKNMVLIVLVICALVLLLWGEFISPDETDSLTTDNTVLYSAQYTKELEKKLESLLSKVSGAGNVEVLLTLESCYENVYAKGYNTKSETDEQSQETEEIEEEDDDSDLDLDIEEDNELEDMFEFSGDELFEL